MKSHREEIEKILERYGYVTKYYPLPEDMRKLYGSQGTVTKDLVADTSCVDELETLINQAKREAVEGFAKWYNDMLVDNKIKHRGMQLIISDNILEQYLNNLEKGEDAQDTLCGS